MRQKLIFHAVGYVMCLLVLTMVFVLVSAGVITAYRFLFMAVAAIAMIPFAMGIDLNRQGSPQPWVFTSLPLVYAASYGIGWYIGSLLP